MHIVLVGMNHRTAPVELRERCALDRSAVAAALTGLRRVHGVVEAVVLTTCNRVEVTAVGPEPEQLIAGLETFLSELGGISRVELTDRLYRYTDAEAARHLFCVASGLDSMVPGEAQVLAQTREAYAWAVEADMAGRLLNGLFQRAFAVAKRIRAETDVSRGRLSVSSVAVDLAHRVFEDFTDKTVLAVGAGETGKLTLVHLSDLGVGRILVANRTRARAAELAERFTGTVIPFEELPASLVEADIVICSTASPEQVLTAEMVRAGLPARRGRPLLLIDIAVPRDVEPEAGRLPGVFLYDIDDLEEVVKSNLDRRQRASGKALDLIEREVEQFYEWLLSLDLGVLVQRFRDTLHQHGRDELEKLQRRLNHLSSDDREAITEAVRRIVNRILHGPMEALHREARRGDTECAEALEKLFGLDGGPTGRRTERESGKPTGPPAGENGESGTKE